MCGIEIELLRAPLDPVLAFSLKWCFRRRDRWLNKTQKNMIYILSFIIFHWYWFASVFHVHHWFFCGWFFSHSLLFLCLLFPFFFIYEILFSIFSFFFFWWRSVHKYFFIFFFGFCVFFFFWVPQNCFRLFSALHWIFFSSRVYVNLHTCIG